MRDELLSEINIFLNKTEMKPTAFGKAAVGDGSFVHNLKRGLDIRMSTYAKVKNFINKGISEPTEKPETKSL